MSNTLFFLIALLLFSSCNSQTNVESINAEPNVKINGLNLVSENHSLSQIHIEPILEVACNYAAVIPFSFMPAIGNPNLSFDSKWQWKGEKVHGTIESIQLLHKNGVKVMIKPQIWIGHGEFTGHIEMKSEKDWTNFEKAYREFILAFAKVAEDQKVDILCIGTELNKFVMQRSAFWEKLIEEIRATYSGKLTYAENWDCYDKVPFWTKLDFVGVDAYFPISDKEKPSKIELVDNWRPIIEELQKVYKRVEKPILFTEYGYRSMTFAAKKPWDFSIKGNVDENTQVESLNALYESIWDKDFFAGGFLWKWHPNHSSAGGGSNSSFTVQNKKAEQIVRFQYSK